VHYSCLARRLLRISLARAENAPASTDPADAPVRIESADYQAAIRRRYGGPGTARWEIVRQRIRFYLESAGYVEGEVLTAKGIDWAQSPMEAWKPWALVAAGAAAYFTIGLAHAWITETYIRSEPLVDEEPFEDPSCPIEHEEPEAPI